VRPGRGLRGGAARFRFHGGELVPADAALGILLGELVVHGWDIALSFAGRFHKP
jgi:hypothetical protein